MSASTVEKKKGKKPWWSGRKTKAKSAVPKINSRVKSGQRQAAEKQPGTRKTKKDKKQHWLDAKTAPDLIATVLSCSLSRYYGKTIEGELKTLLPFVPKVPVGAMHTDLTHDVVRELLLLQDFHKKYPGLPGTDDKKRRATAIDTWYRCEAECFLFNAKAAASKSDMIYHSKSSSLVGQVLRLARQFVYDVIGECPSLDVQFGAGRHGPGSSVGFSGNRTTPYYKASAFPITVTQAALPYAFTRLARDPYWFCAGVSQLLGYHFTVIPPYADRLRLVKEMQNHFFKIVLGDKIAFVPKDADTERPITVSPLMNLYIQLGVDSFIRERLSLFGIELNTQEVNRSLALVGSTDPTWDSPVTMDLKTASEKIATECVRFFVSRQWFAFLDDIRSPGGLLPETPFERYHKFSGMGNGFTFALESLIFVAIARASTVVTGGVLSRVHIHGDDIICPRNAALLCWETLEVCGFAVNTNKSFLFGPFRESCGIDAWDGTDVRAIKVKEETRDVRSVYRLLNWIRKQIIIHGASFYVTHYQRLLKTLTPRQLKLVGPCTEDDGHIHCSEVLLKAILPFNRKKQSFMYRTVIDVANRYDRSLMSSDQYNGWAHGWSFLYQSQKGDDTEQTSRDAVSITRRASTRKRVVAVPLHGKPSISQQLQGESVTDFLLNAALEVSSMNTAR